MGLKIIFVSSEATPYAKTGGLADVAGSLPTALAGLGHDVSLFLPYYRTIAEAGHGEGAAEPTGVMVSVPVGRRIVEGEVLKARGAGGGAGSAGAKDVSVYFIRRDEYFDRTHLYGTPEGDYFDNLERYAFFSRAVLEAAKALKLSPDIIHSNDWQTGLVPFFLRELYGYDADFLKTRSIFTIHNTAYQGSFPDVLFDTLNLPGRLFTLEGLEFWGRINLLKAGIVSSDIITTVSETYSREIQTPEFGCGLEGLFKYRAADLYGVLNGVDYGEWDPTTDGLIPARYSAKELTGKNVCKEELIKAFGLKTRPYTPVIGMVSRLAAQKGFDILTEAAPALMKLSAGFVVLGAGDKIYQDMLKKLAKKYPGKFALKVAYDNRLAHLIEAGSDIFLMPSRYEPCGLNQIYSLRYGTIPVVRATGGLDDTVTEYKLEGGNGFKFVDYTPGALSKKVREAVKVFKDKDTWRTLQRNAMKEDFSWRNSAKTYVELYRKACGKK
jgi:starch synthase